MGGCSGRDRNASVSLYGGRGQLHYLHLQPAEHMGRWRAHHRPAGKHRLLHLHKSTRRLLPGRGFTSLTIYALWAVGSGFWILRALPTQWVPRSLAFFAKSAAHRRTRWISFAAQSAFSL